MPHLSIDGLAVEVADGRSVLQAALDNGIEIPTACFDVRLEPSGACRLCMVDIEGRERPVASCSTPVEDGMVVRTDTPTLVELRRTLRGLMATEDRGRSDSLVDDSHPLIHVDLNRCIKCWRCVRICAEVQGQFVWQIDGRGEGSRVAVDGGALGDSPCVSCGACVDTCPTDALEDRNLLDTGDGRGAAAPSRWTRTTCPYCGVGCEMLVGTHEGRVVTVRPALDAPVNRGHLCVKGRYGHGFVHAADRRHHPLVRDPEGQWRQVSFEEAVTVAANGLRDALEEGGSGAVGVLGSARATNEDNYLVQKLARAVLGTNNVDCCARVCHAPSAAGLKAVFGTGAATSSFNDIEVAATILLCGANATENHPVVGARIKQAKLAGANLIVIDPRRIELAEVADLHLRPRAGTNVALLNAMASVIVSEGLMDAAFVAERAEGLDAFVDHISKWSPERAEAICGVAAADVRRAARLYATAKPAISFHGLGVTEHTQGTEGVMCLANLAMLTGNLGRPGAGVNPLRGQNNVQGAAHMGCEPSHLPGFAPLAGAAQRVGDIWGAEVPTEGGLDVMQMIDAAAEGDLKALLVSGWDLLLTQPDMAATKRALARLDTLVVVDLFLNETAREYATVFLPAAASFEKDGTFMNSERRVQRIRAAIDPPGEARADWRIVSALAAELGRADLFAYSSAGEIWDEVRRVWGPGAGMSWDRLDAPGGLQWPCPSGDHPGTSMLHVCAFGADQGTRAELRPIDFTPTPEEPDSGFPFVLVTGRSLYSFNAGTMSARSDVLALRPTDRLEICASDASDIGVIDGELVNVVSRYGQTKLSVEITERVAAGTVFATFCDPATQVNRLTGPHRDPYTHTPEYKVTAVRLVGG